MLACASQHASKKLDAAKARRLVVSEDGTGREVAGIRIEEVTGLRNMAVAALKNKEEAGLLETRCIKRQGSRVQGKKGVLGKRGDDQTCEVREKRTRGSKRIGESRHWYKRRVRE